MFRRKNCTKFFLCKFKRKSFVFKLLGDIAEDFFCGFKREVVRMEIPWSGIGHDLTCEGVTDTERNFELSL